MIRCTTLADPREPAVRQGFARSRLLGSAGLWLLDALRPLQGCGVLFLSQFTMDVWKERIREAWGSTPIVSAVEATVAELFGS